MGKAIALEPIVTVQILSMLGHFFPQALEHANQLSVAEVVLT